MRTFTKAQLEDAAREGDGVCTKCGTRCFGFSEDERMPCDNCGAQAVLSAEVILDIAALVEED